MTHLSTQVCVIGAGPAGALLGILLARAGIDCIVVERLDRDEVPVHAPRAGLIEHRTVELLKTHGLAGRLLDHGIRHGSIEFRTPDVAFLFDYAALCGGVSSWVYPQADLIKDLTGALIAAGAQVHYGLKATSIREQGAQLHVELSGRDQSAPTSIDCEWVAGCDGFRGVARASMPSGSFRGFAREYELAWLTLLAAAPPSGDHNVYALHPRGFAGQFLRTSTMTRYMLQVDRKAAVADWPDERVWSELQMRMGRALNVGSIESKGILDMACFVAEPMQAGSILLAGDAAHKITPAGGKGMNLALQDADELAAGLIEHYKGRRERLSAYSDTRLPRVWRAQEFSNGMLEMMHSFGDDPLDGPYLQRVRQARLHQLNEGGAFAVDFAEKYVGL
jgi:p-hydroxybenzoate 3-monooxygenase